MSGELIIGKKLRKEIIKFIESNQPEVYWGQNEGLDESYIKKILASEDGICKVEDELWQANLDYIADLENEFVNKTLFEELLASGCCNAVRA